MPLPHRPKMSVKNSSAGKDWSLTASSISVMRSRSTAASSICHTANERIVRLPEHRTIQHCNHPHQQVKPPLAPPQMNLKRRRASVAVLLRSPACTH